MTITGVDLNLMSEAARNLLRRVNQYRSFEPDVSNCHTYADTRSVQKVRRLTQLATRYAHHILSLFNTFSCN